MVLETLRQKDENLGVAMALVAINPITNIELNSLEMNLFKNFALRYHYRNGAKRKIKYFCVAWVKPDEQGMIYGHLSGKNGMDAQFSIRKGQLNPLYRINPNASGASLVVLEEEIKHSVKMLYQRTLNVKILENFNTRNWEGYYLVRNNSAPGVTARDNMQRAINEGIISVDFQNTCLDIGIHMKYFA